jgi:PhnB protein
MQGFIPSLTVTDMDRSVRFYEDALGFKSTFVIPGPDGAPVFTSLSHGEATLMLGLAPTEPSEPVAAGTLGAGVNLYVTVTGSDDIDTLFERAWNAGARVITKPIDQFWGDRDWTVADPDGYQITVGKQMRVLSPEEMLAAAATMAAPA